jgi:hypothetical protein
MCGGDNHPTEVRGSLAVGIAGGVIERCGRITVRLTSMTEQTGRALQNPLCPSHLSALATSQPRPAKEGLREALSADESAVAGTRFVKEREPLGGEGTCLEGERARAPQRATNTPEPLSLRRPKRVPE